MVSGSYQKSVSKRWLSHPLCCWFQPTRIRPVWVAQAWPLGYRLNGCRSMFAIRRHVWYTDCWMHLWNLYFKVGSNLLAGRLVFCSAFWEVSGKVAGCRLESYPGLWCASTSARFASKDGVLGAKSLLRSTSGKFFYVDLSLLVSPSILPFSNTTKPMPLRRFVL